jgi:hypothetical protein
MQSVKVFLVGKMRIIIFLITILMLPQSIVNAGGIDSIPKEMRSTRQGAHNTEWNKLTMRYVKYVQDKDSWNYCVDTIVVKPEGKWRRVAVCYLEEEGRLLEKHDLNISMKIMNVMERELKRFYDAADTLDYAMIVKRGNDAYFDSASNAMVKVMRNYENVALPRVMMEVFEELNEKDKARQINLKSQSDKRKKIAKQKKKEEAKIFKPKSLLKKLLGVN